MAIEDWSGQRTSADLLTTPLGRELLGLSRRMLGPGPVANQAVVEALQHAATGRLPAIIACAQACHRHASAPVAVIDGPRGTLDEAVAAELAHANAALPSRHREALVLRERMRLSYGQIARVMGLDVSAIALLLARARLRLRTELRGPYSGDETPCGSREQSLRLLARHQDSESLGPEDEAWVLSHLTACPSCERAHAQMLEASLRYRAWTLT